MNVSSYIYIRMFVVVKEGDEICYLGRNKSSEFINIWQCLHVLEEKSDRRDNFPKYHNFLLESENPDMKIFKLFSILEDQGGYIKLNITIHNYKVRGTWMDNPGEYSPSRYLMSMSADNFVGLRFHLGFYTSVISNFH